MDNFIGLNFERLLRYRIVSGFFYLCHDCDCFQRNKHDRVPDLFLFYLMFLIPVMVYFKSFEHFFTEKNCLISIILMQHFILVSNILGAICFNNFLIKTIKTLGNYHDN